MPQINRSLLPRWAAVCLLLQVSPCLTQAAADFGWLQGWSSISQQSFGSGAALQTEQVPRFWQWLLADLEGVQDGSETRSLLNATDLIHQAQTWANDLQGSLGVGSFSGKLLAQNWKVQVYNNCLALAEDLLAVRPKLQQLYFNYWNATYQRYAGYIEQARLARGFSPTGPLIDELVQRFRAYTGTTCTPASFTPPADTDAEISGRGYVLTFAGGNCQITRVASQTRRDFVYRCALPRASLAVTQARYSSQYVSPATFAGTVCRRQYTYGRDSTIRIQLWNPGAFAQDGSRKSLFLPLSDADGDGIPNFLDKLSRYQSVRQVLKSYRTELATTLTQTTTTVEKAAHRLAERLKAAGLDVYIDAGASKLQGELAARRAVREATRHDLSQLFPDLHKVKLGKGVQYIYDKVLEGGLMATLYQRRRGDGIFSMFQSATTDSGAEHMQQSAAGMNSSSDEQAPGSEEDAWQAVSNGVPQDIFKRLADEMDQLLTLRAAAQEVASDPPTGRKVIKPGARATTGQATSGVRPAPQQPRTAAPPAAGREQREPTADGGGCAEPECSSGNVGSSRNGGASMPDGYAARTEGASAATERIIAGTGGVHAGTLAESAAHLVHSLGTIFTQAAESGVGEIELSAAHVIGDIAHAFSAAAGAVAQNAVLDSNDYDDGGMEVPYD